MFHICKNNSKIIEKKEMFSLNEKQQICISETQIHVLSHFLHAYSITNMNFYDDDEVIFQDLMPLAFNIMEELLKNYVVFTLVADDEDGYELIKTEEQKEEDYKRLNSKCARMKRKLHSFLPKYIQERRERPNTMRNFPNYYYLFLKSHNLQNGNAFYNGKGTIITVTDGFNLPMMNAAFAAPELIWGTLVHYVIGFRENPLNINDSDFSSVFNLLKKGDYDFVFEYYNFHPDLNVYMNKDIMNYHTLIERLELICKENGKVLIK